MDGSFDDEAGVEIDGQGRSAQDAVEKLVGFDDLEVVEAHLMAGRDDEPLVGRMRWTHQDLPEPLSLRRPFRDIDLDLVETLLVENDPASRAERLQLQAAFAAPGAAADLDRSRRAVGHSQEGGGDVASLDRPAAAAVGAIRIRPAHLPEHLVWGAEQGREELKG